MRERPLTNVDNLDKRPIKHFKRENNDITFRNSDAHRVHHPHCDALVITAMVTNINMHGILVDDSPV